MNTQNTTAPLRHIAAVRFPVILLFCLLIVSTASAAAEGTHPESMNILVLRPVLHAIKRKERDS
jgi:hypothetical protein